MLEDAIPSGTKAGTVRGLPPRDVMEFVGQGELQLSCLKLGKQEKKVVKCSTCASAVLEGYVNVNHMYMYICIRVYGVLALELN